MLGKFTDLEVLRLFLHGLFAIYPAAVFPALVSLLGPIGILTIVVLAGSILYAAPVDRLIPSYKKFYIDELESRASAILKVSSNRDIRAVYDTVFWNDYSDTVRYRVQYLVSLYYFYSRTFAISLVYSIAFVALLILVSVEWTEGTATFIPGEAPLVLLAKAVFLLIISAVVTTFAFQFANNIITRVARFEIALLEKHTTA